MNHTIQSQALLQKIMHLINEASFVDDSLSFGRSGVALLNFYYGNYFNDATISSKGLELIETIVENLSEGRNQALATPDYFSGITGFLFVLNNLRENNLLETSVEDFAALDAMAFEWSRTQLQENNIDFFYGATSFLYYLCNNMQHETSAQYIDELVELLASRFSENDSRYGIVNRTYNQMDNRQNAEINYSLAHGMISVLLTLTALWQKGYRKHNIDKLVKNTIDGLLALSETQESHGPVCFAGAVNMDTGQVLYQKRMGWCYSDINVIHLLYAAGKVFNEPQWTAVANRHLAAVASRKTTEETLVTDPFLCHGSAGLFLYYQFLHSLAGEEVLLNTAEYWQEEALAYFERTSDEYFKSAEFNKTGHIHSLFYGLTGVALCLLSALDKKNSAWSSIIMLS